MEKYFTKDEALDMIKEALLNGYEGYYCDLHNEVFNTDYYIIGTYKAEKALEQYGVFKAMEKIKEYEQDEFGEVSTDFSNPEQVANSLEYIIGEEVMYDLENNSETFDNNQDTLANDELNNKILAELDE